MKVNLITIMLLVMAVWPAISQRPPGAPTNILIGDTQIMAVYPDMSEFILNVPASQVTIVRFDSDGNDRQSTYDASLTQAGPDVYRAEFCGSSWFEINTVTGSTTLCHLGNLEAFFPAEYAGR